jgi:hypothetical protein
MLYNVKKDAYSLSYLWCQRLAWQQKTQKNGNKVKSHLFKLYFENTPLLAKHPWEWETERWFELIFCILTEGIGIKPSLARRATNALAELKLISVPLLARDPKTDLIKEVLLQIGFSKDEANKATDATVRISEVSKQKWNVLKRILKVFSAYNFDIIIDKETRSRAMNNLILSGGSGEFFKSAEQVVHHSHSLLGRVQLAGLNAYLNYLSNLNLRRSRQSHNDHNYDDENHNNNTTLKKENKEDDNAAISIYHKLREISLQLDFVDLGFAQQEFLKYADTEPQKVKELLGLSQIQILEEAFAKEITLLYYFALNNATDFAFSQPMKHLSLMYSEAEKEYFSAISKPKNPRPKDRDDNFDPYAILTGSIIPLSPRRRLHAILRQDKEIQEWFSSWITDLARYNEEIVEKMATIRNETQPKK